VKAQLRLHDRFRGPPEIPKPGQGGYKTGRSVALVRLFINDPHNLGRGRYSVGGLVVPTVVTWMFALSLHLLIAVVGFPDALALFLVVLARDRNHGHVVVFVIFQN